MNCLRTFARGCCAGLAVAVASAGCSQKGATDETAKPMSATAIKNIAHKPVTEDVPAEPRPAEPQPAENSNASAAAEEKSTETASPQTTVVEAEKISTGAGILAEDPLDSADPIVPVVAMSEQHASTCLVKVGDTFPNATLPDINGDRQDVAKLLGEQLTIVLFWSPENRSSMIELGELAARVASPLHARGIRVVGICEHGTAETAKRIAESAGVSFPILLDDDGALFSHVATSKIPRLSARRRRQDRVVRHRVLACHVARSARMPASTAASLKKVSGTFFLPWRRIRLFWSHGAPTPQCRGRICLSRLEPRGCWPKDF